MEGFKGLVIILLSSVLVNNYVLSRFLGICPFLGVSKKINQAVGMGVSVTVVMLLATLVTWPIQHFVLEHEKLNRGYMQTIVFILVIAALVQMLDLFLKRFIPALHKGLGVYLPLITTNCAVLGVAINNVTDGFTFVECLQLIPEFLKDGTITMGEYLKNLGMIYLFVIMGGFYTLKNAFKK